MGTWVVEWVSLSDNVVRRRYFGEDKAQAEFTYNQKYHDPNVDRNSLVMYDQRFYDKQRGLT